MLKSTCLSNQNYTNSYLHKYRHKKIYIYICKYLFMYSFNYKVIHSDLFGWIKQYLLSTHWLPSSPSSTGHLVKKFPRYFHIRKLHHVISSNILGFKDEIQFTFQCLGFYICVSQFQPKAFAVLFWVLETVYESMMHYLSPQVQSLNNDKSVPPQVKIPLNHSK